MATWINHLRVAALLLDRFPLSRRGFLAGSIAPDCGTEVGFGRYDPPKEVTHWRSGELRCDYRAFGREMFPKAKGGEQRAFLLGYYCHLMEDCLWAEWVNEPAKRRFESEYLADRESYYRRAKSDWYDADALFLQKHPDFGAFGELGGITGFDSGIVPYYARDTVQRQIGFIVGFYRERVGIDLSDRKFVYFTPAQADEYVTRAFESVSEELSRIKDSGIMG